MKRYKYSITGGPAYWGQKTRHTLFHLSQTNVDARLTGPEMLLLCKPEEEPFSNSIARYIFWLLYSNSTAAFQRGDPFL